MANSIKLEIQLEGKNAQQTITALNKNLSNLGKNGTSSIGKMSSAWGSFVGNIGAIGVTKAIGLIGNAFGDVVGNALAFSKSIAEINSIAPRTSKETLTLKNNLLALSSAYGKDAQGQAKSFYNIVSAGVTDTSKAMQVLTVANKASVAGLVDVNTAAEGLLSVMNSYTDGSVSAASASDILFTAVKEGRTTFGELASTIGRVASISSSAGVQFKEIGGALAFVTKSGIRTDEAVIGLRQLLTGVIGPTKDVASTAKKLGIEFSATALKTQGLAGFMTNLREKTGGNVETLKKLFPNVRAFNIAVKIAGGDIKDFNRIMSEMGKASEGAGATQKALETITKSAGFQFDKLKNQLKNLPNSFLTNFEAPISDALQAINKFVSKQGILLIADAVKFAIDAFDSFQTAGANVKAFLAAIASAGAELGIKWTEMALAINGAIQSTQKFLGLDVSASTKREEEALNSRIAGLKEFQKAQEEGAIAELNSSAELSTKIAGFRQKIVDAKAKQIEDQKALDEEEAIRDQEKAQQQLDNLTTNEQAKVDLKQTFRDAEKEQKKQTAAEELIFQKVKNDAQYKELAKRLGKDKT